MDDPEKMSLMSKMSKKKKESEFISDENSRLDQGTNVCCCECMCSNKRLEGLTCFCCFSISCGVYSIAFLIVCLTIFFYTEIFVSLLDDEIAWWYVLIGVILLIPAIVASSFAIRFFIANN